MPIPHWGHSIDTYPHFMKMANFVAIRTEFVRFPEYT